MRDGPIPHNTPLRDTLEGLAYWVEGLSEFVTQWTFHLTRVFERSVREGTNQSFVYRYVLHIHHVFHNCCMSFFGTFSQFNISYDYIALFQLLVIAACLMHKENDPFEHSNV